MKSIQENTIVDMVLAIRGYKVMLDKDLAILYGVKPTALRQQVKRNKDRFPDDFMFQLTTQEVEIMVSQNVIPSKQVLGHASIQTTLDRYGHLLPLKNYMGVGKRLDEKVFAPQGQEIQENSKI